MNENAGLIVMHTVWVREHNRLARIMAQLNPHWDDHQIFEEARRIVGAQVRNLMFLYSNTLMQVIQSFC